MSSFVNPTSPLEGPLSAIVQGSVFNNLTKGWALFPFLNPSYCLQNIKALFLSYLFWISPPAYSPALRLRWASYNEPLVSICVNYTSMTSCTWVSFLLPLLWGYELYLPSFAQVSKQTFPCYIIWMASVLCHICYTIIIFRWSMVPHSVRTRTCLRCSRKFLLLSFLRASFF